MPISKENKAKYPDNWKGISLRIRHVRAKNRCECRGQCGYDHQMEAKTITASCGVRATMHLDDHKRCMALNRSSHPVTGSKVVLTVAHLDHKLEDHSDENLMACCQRCHLKFDHQQHIETKRANRNKNQGSFPW